MNICKIRVLKFMQPQGLFYLVVRYLILCFVLMVFSFSLSSTFAFAENGVSCRARTRMIMSEKPYDGTVAMHYGEIEDGEFLAVEDYLPTLPNTVSSVRILFLQSKKDLPVELVNTGCSQLFGGIKADDSQIFHPVKSHLPNYTLEFLNVLLTKTYLFLLWFFILVFSTFNSVLVFFETLSYGPSYHPTGASP